jgi:hypothetical protein
MPRNHWPKLKRRHPVAHLHADARMTRMDVRRTCRLRVLVTLFLQSRKLGCRQQHRKQQSRRRHDHVQRARAYACMPEHQKSRLVLALIVRGEVEPDLVTGLEAPGVRYQRNPVAYRLADWNRCKGPAIKHRHPGLACHDIDLSQSRTQVAGGHINGLIALADVLKNRDEGGVRRGAGGVKLQLDGSDDIEVLR